jgi:hypothetical protein
MARIGFGMRKFMVTAKNQGSHRCMVGVRQVVVT